MYNINYIYIGAFLFIPALIQATNYKYTTFFNTITFFNIIYIIFNIYLSFILGLDRFQINSKLGALINYDNMCIVFAILSFIYSFHLKSKYSNVILIISFLSILLNVNHATRSTWMLLPFLFMTIFWVYRYKAKIFIVISLFFSILSLIFLFTTKNNFIPRIYDTIYDINAMIHQSDKATSIGSRIDMWRIALGDFYQSPIYGKGTFNIAENLCYLSQQGFLAGNCLTHMHNIFFQELSTHGILGFISICIIIFLPLIYFIRKYFNTDNSTIKFLSLSASFCVLSFLASSTTDFYFISNIAAAFYGLIIFTLYGLIISQEKNHI
ncbi:O-antigen ligase family protein [Acinetobacter larvae]|nr:O-antigen ligase family protein [Acinetobacter larvae]